MDDNILNDQADWHDLDNVEQDVPQQDGFCVITGYGASLCDVANIIPRYKGDEVGC